MSATIPPTANERFRRQSRTVGWLAAIAAVLLHAAILLFAPPFSVDASKASSAGLRFVLGVSDWQEPVCVSGCGAGFVPFDTTWAQPALTNRGALNLEIPPHYPPLLWHFREPSHGLFEIAVGRNGRVQAVTLLESSENGGEESLTQLARMMRFDPVTVDGSRVAVVATVVIEILAPRQGWWGSAHD